MKVETSKFSIEKKRGLIEGTIKEFGEEKLQGITKDLNDEQIEFLFKYLFTRSKEDRDKLRNHMQTKHEKSLNNLAMEGEQIQKIMIKYREISSRENLPSLDGDSK